MLDRKYVIVIVIIIIVVAYFNLRARDAAKSSKGKGSGSSGSSSSSADSSGTVEKTTSKPAAKGTAESGKTKAAGKQGLSANALFRAVHGQMQNGMNHETFASVAPEYNRGMVFVELKQLYAAGRIPQPSDYAKILAAEGVV